MTAKDVILTVAFALVGGVIGWVYCLLVRRTVADIVGDGGGMTKFLSMMVLRVVMVAAGLAAAAYFGIWPVVGNMVGFVVVRSVIVGRSRIKATAEEEARKIREAREERVRNG